MKKVYVIAERNGVDYFPTIFKKKKDAKAYCLACAQDWYNAYRALKGLYSVGVDSCIAYVYNIETEEIVYYAEVLTVKFSDGLVN